MKRSARVTFLLAYISRYIYRAGYVLTFKRGCYWIMNVPKRPKFRIRGEHYFRQGSNNFVRFYITRLWSQRRARVSSSTCATCWKVHTFDRCNTYVTGPRHSFRICCLLAFFLSFAKKTALQMKCVMCDEYYLVNLSNFTIRNFHNGKFQVTNVIFESVPLYKSINYLSKSIIILYQSEQRYKIHFCCAHFIGATLLNFHPVRIFGLSISMTGQPCKLKARSVDSPRANNLLWSRRNICFLINKPGDPICAECI